MTGIAMMLRSLGVKVEESHLRAVEILIPQIPAKLNEAYTVINAALKAGDARLAAVESGLGTAAAETTAARDDLRILQVRVESLEGSISTLAGLLSDYLKSHHQEDNDNGGRTRNHPGPGGSGGAPGSGPGPGKRRANSGAN